MFAISLAIFLKVQAGFVYFDSRLEKSLQAQCRQRHAPILHHPLAEDASGCVGMPFYCTILCAFCDFGLFPYLYAIVLSFQNWDGISAVQWVGLANYQKLLTDPIWWLSLGNSIWLMISSLLNLVVALVLAFLLNNGIKRGKEFYRTAYFMPIVASSIAVTMVFTTLFGRNYGFLNFALGYLGIAPIDWLGQSVWVKPAIALVLIWRWF